MAKLPLDLELRLLLSWRMQTKVHERKAGQHQHQGNRAVGFYALQIKEAEQRIQAFRARETRNIESLGVKLRKALDQQEQLTAQGQENRKLAKQILQLQRELNHYNLLLTTKDPQALGGEIVLPLEDYPKRLEQRSWVYGINPLSTTDQRTLAMTLVLVIAVFVGISLFWNWDGQLQFEVFPRFKENALLVRIHNATAAPITIALPDTPEGTYSISVVVQEGGGEGSELITVSDDVLLWRYNDRATTQQEPIALLQGLHCDVLLDLGSIRSAFPEARTLQLSFLNERGSTLATHKVELPSQPKPVQHNDY